MIVEWIQPNQKGLIFFLLNMFLKVRDIFVIGYQHNLMATIRSQLFLSISEIFIFNDCYIMKVSSNFLSQPFISALLNVQEYIFDFCILIPIA